MYRRYFLMGLLVAGCLAGFSQNNNVALHKPVVVSSEAPGYPASNIVDGVISRTSIWEASSNRAPHLVEIDLRKYYNITGLKIHSGIADAEKKPGEMTQAAGFWSVKNFKMQYWDDANWSDFPQSEVHENRLTTVAFNYKPAVTTFKIRLVCDDGEPISIMEIEAFGTEAPNMPEPPVVNSNIRQEAMSTEPKDATISVTNKVVGKTLKYVGYNQGYYMPGSNVSGWLEYSNVNSLRVWATMNSFVPDTAVQVDKTLTSIAEFDKRKSELRKAPENNAFIHWNQLLPLYDLPDSSSTNAMVFNYALSELKRLGIDVVLQMGGTDFEDNWTNKWKQWQRYYALAYHAAKQGDVTMFAMQNEPNHRNSGPMKLEQWIMGMQIVSDAVHCAVQDVNKQYAKRLTPKFVGPVTAGNNPEWWAAVAKNIRTDYHGKTVDKDLLEIFSTHSYNSPAAGYETRIQNIEKTLRDNHPNGDSLPVVYTEIGRWMNAYLIDKEETMDSPSLFTEWAGIYSNNMKNGGYGMWAFKFANTASSTYPRGIKSGHHFIWQGRRIVEDAYTNIALGKPVNTSNKAGNTKLVTDGNKSDVSTWVSDTATKEKWLEIDLGKSFEIGSAVVYSGDASGMYTSPTRIKNFKLRYLSGNDWKDIPGMAEKENKYAQNFFIFKEAITTNKIRLTSNDAGALKIREIKLFAKGDGPTGEPNYNVSGIQRTGEVVRLFAKGFKDERPLMETKCSEDDTGLDSYTSYDEKSGNYYMWLVQRDGFNYNLNINLKALDIPVGAPVTAETVSPDYYGEITQLFTLNDAKQLGLTLVPQSVVLLTIPKNRLLKSVTTASADATVAGGKNAGKNDGLNKQLIVQLDASHPDNNKVTYIHFDELGAAKNAGRIILKVNGRTDRGDEPYRLHVYGIPTDKLDQQQLSWNNAPLLDAKEALINDPGQKAFIAGELAFSNKPHDHFLDVTDAIKKHVVTGVTFVLVRETRQIGDDEDKGRKVHINSSESTNKPELIFWTGK
ncbi:MAG: discoidin domain-containing protein [Chitinophagaceae bacterium]